MRCNILPRRSCVRSLGCRDATADSRVVHSERGRELAQAVAAVSVEADERSVALLAQQMCEFRDERLALRARDLSVVGLPRSTPEDAVVAAEVDRPAQCEPRRGRTILCDEGAIGVTGPHWVVRELRAQPINGEKRLRRR